MISSDALRFGDELNDDVPTRDLKAKRSILPFLLVVTIQIFDLIIPTVTGYVWYLAYCASFQPSFWTVCGKFSVVDRKSVV